MMSALTFLKLIALGFVVVLAVWHIIDKSNLRYFEVQVIILFHLMHFRF